ncbi:MAG TPA: ATP-binding protein [Polyangia bacterium]|jgi:signal transduction histidine kinase|nr:ATP-binding protein [Polyangia bacterium]
MKVFRLPGRFEWKILIALFIVATLPLGAAGYLMRVTLDRVTRITSAHQESVEQSLGGAVEVYRSYFAQMKEIFRQRSAEVASQPVAHASDLADVPELLRARILDGTRVIDEWSAPPAVQDRAREGPPNLVELPGSKPEAPRLLELTFGISKEIYANFLALGEAMQREQDLDRVLPVVLPRIFRGLGAALIIVLALATAMGLFVARRATGRVAMLREAARRVGEGDLAVRVSPRGKDELDELGRAFDRMVAELAEARPRLEYLQKVSAWQEVARRLAHEIKNPLTPIQLSVQELVSKYRGDDPAYAKLLATAQEILGEEIGTIRRLVDDFSAFAKLPKVAPAPVDLGQIVDDFVRAHGEWQPFLTFVPPAAPVGAECDRMLIRRVLANLVENAVQAATGAGREPAVTLSVAADAERRVASLVVDDNGPGIPARERERVFDPYVTSKEHGTGLGLAIVRKIVLDHGGDVHASAAPGGGARLTVTLPAAGRSGTSGPRASESAAPDALR